MKEMIEFDTIVFFICAISQVLGPIKRSVTLSDSPIITGEHDDSEKQDHRRRENKATLFGLYIM